MRSVDPQRRSLGSCGWELACTAPGAAPQTWKPIGLDTVAAALRAAGDWSLDAEARRFDAHDWWYRLRFDAPTGSHGARIVLGFDGLAGPCDIALNGESLLASDNMFQEHEVTLAGLNLHDNELVLKFPSLDVLLSVRRPRPRWRAPMIENQQLRWFRTALLGRMPGWSPPAPLIGPWRPIWLDVRNGPRIHDFYIRASLNGSTGVVEASGRIEPAPSTSSEPAELIITRNGASFRAPLRIDPDSRFGTARLEIPSASLWWPHTHGEPALYDVQVVMPADGGRSAEILTSRRIGFRTLSIDTGDGDFRLSVNGVAVFCRGACWMPLDPVSPHIDASNVEGELAQAREAGMNMLRISGTTVYESDRFLDACDEQGMLLWQDFMFANMDYPGQDPAFCASVEREAKQLLARVAGRPSLAVLCGNSECEQQAAMWGAPRDTWGQSLFDQTLRTQCAKHAPDVLYWPSSAHGGAFPHQGDTGTTSYYGVGAYRRPLSDARLSALRFATECLAFAQIPDDSTVAAMPGGASLKVHHPAWKARTPRDLGAGWDFEDVRDHYLRELFHVDPLELRYADHERYLELSRLAPAEAMTSAFREWRRGGSSCRGALIWIYRDLWRGAGWGIVDADGRPKAPWYCLRRILQPRAVLLLDEGGNGLDVHLLNESGHPLSGSLDISAYRSDGLRVAHCSHQIDLAARGTLELAAAAGLDGFFDLTYAYRFGPPSHEVVVATLSDATGAVIARDFYFPLGHTSRRESDLGLEADAARLANGDWQLTLCARRCARFVHIAAERFEADDQYFHLAPGVERSVILRAGPQSAALKGSVRASNASAPVKIGIRE